MSHCAPSIDRGVASGAAVASSPTGAPGWTLAQRVRFSALANQILVNGPQALVAEFGSPIFTVANAPSAAVFRVQNGAGLEFSAGTSTAWAIAGGSQTAVNLRIAWRDLVPNYDPTRRYFLEARLSANNADAASERVTIGVIREAGVPAGSSRAIAGAFNGHNGVALMSGLLASNSAGTGSIDYPFPTADVLGLLVDPGSPSGAAAYCGLAVAGDYPPMSAMRPTTWTQQTGTPGAVTADAFNDPFAEVFIAFPTGNFTATMVATIADLRVLVAA